MLPTCKKNFLCLGKKFTYVDFQVHLAMEDHRTEQYKPPNAKVKPFQGHGYTLGRPAPVVVGAQNDEDKPANEARAKEVVKVNSSEPTTR